MKKIRNWCQKYASQLLVGIICTIITTAFNNIYAAIKEIGPSTGVSLFRFFSNYFFTTLSKTTETSILSVLFSVLVGISIACVIDILVKGVTLSKRLLKDGNDIITLINEDKEKIKVSEKEKITLEEIKNETKDIIKQGKKIRILTILFGVFFAFYFVNVIVFTMLPNVMFREYQRDIIKISPYAEQQELDIIKSDWVCMQSKDDYDDIYKRIDKVKKEHKLP